MSDPAESRSSRSETDMTALSVVIILLLLVLAGGGGFMLWRWRTIEQMRERALVEEMRAREEADAARQEAEQARAEAEAAKHRKNDPQVEDLLRAGRPRAAQPTLEQGTKLCRQGQVGEGLLWFVRGLEQSADDPTLQRTFRTCLAAWGQTLPNPWTLFASKSPVTALAFSPDGKTALIGTEDGGARARSLDGGKPVGEGLTTEGQITAVGFVAAGKEWLIASGGLVHRFDATTAQALGEAVESPGAVLAMTPSANGKVLLLGTCGQGLLAVRRRRARGGEEPDPPRQRGPGGCPECGRKTHPDRPRGPHGPTVRCRRDSSGQSAAPRRAGASRCIQPRLPTAGHGGRPGGTALGYGRARADRPPPGAKGRCAEPGLCAGRTQVAER